MKKVLSIILICLGIILVFGLITFADIKIKERADYIQAYNRCVEARSNDEVVEMPVSEDVAESIRKCEARGGCFDPCGNSCGSISGYLPTTNLISVLSPKMCTLVCLSHCIEKP